jgi:MFS family permease
LTARSNEAVQRQRDITSTYLRWIATRAFLHRGYWLVASLYLVVDAHLSAFQLVVLGTAQGCIALAVEVPAGVVADTLSRKWALVIAHALVGSSMALTGLVTAFPALVATQMLWGVGWCFASGADVAWITDELRRPERIAAVLTSSARWEQLGAIGGLVGFGLLAVAVGRGPALVVAGVAMAALGVYVRARFTEHGFSATTTRRWKHSAAIFRRGIAVARRDREILLMLVATVLINGAAETYGRLYPKRLVTLGFPGRFEPIIWFTGLGIAAFIAGALALRLLEAHIDGVGVARRVYVATCFVGALGLVTLASAPSFCLGGAGVLLVSGVALTVTRAVGVIWVNRGASSDVRATLQSLLAQAEYSGEILCGILLGALARFTTISAAFMCAAALFAGAGVLVRRLSADDR